MTIFSGWRLLVEGQKDIFGQFNNQRSQEVYDSWTMNKAYYNELLALEEAGKVEIDIGHRGGHYGLSDKEALVFVGEDENHAGYLPNKVGAYCNYLGGGLRGAICESDFSDKLEAGVAKKIRQFTAACKRRYEEIEKEWAESPDSYTDEWNEEGTRACRAQGIESAY